MALRPGFSLMDWNNLARVSDVARGQHSTTRQINMDELRRHKDWCCIRGKVYDFSQYIPYHPGGADELERGAADDCTALFDEFHPWVNVDTMFRRCQVGVLVDPTNVWTPAPVETVEDLGGHMFRIRFKIENEDFVQALRNAQDKEILFHVKLRTRMGSNNRYIERPYTPLVGTFFDEKNTDGRLTVLIKRSTQKSRLCLSHALCSEQALAAKVEVQIKPLLTIKMDWYINSASIGLVCAGSGITPALQVLSREASLLESSRKRLYLVWCNRNQGYTCLRAELAALVTKFGGRLTLIHLFSRAEACTEEFLNSKHEFEEIEYGRFDEDFLARRPEALPRPAKHADDPKSAILMCGTWEFERSVRATMFMAGFGTDSLVRIPG